MSRKIQRVGNVNGWENKMDHGCIFHTFTYNKNDMIADPLDPQQMNPNSPYHFRGIYGCSNERGEMGMWRRWVRFQEEGREWILPGLLYARDLVLCASRRRTKGNGRTFC